MIIVEIQGCFTRGKKIYTYNQNETGEISGAYNEEIGFREFNSREVHSESGRKRRVN